MTHFLSNAFSNRNSNLTRNSRGNDRKHDQSNDDANGLAVQEAKPRVAEPPKYMVMLLNDDYTPMDFVVDVLQRFFKMDRTKSTRVMLEVHTKGRGVCGTFTAQIAETKVAQVNGYARQHQHPLLCVMEAQ